METFEKLRTILEKEISCVTETQTIDHLLDIHNEYEEDFQFIKTALEEYSMDLQANENYLKNTVGLVTKLSNIISIKHNHFNNDNSKTINEKFQNSEELAEKIELEKCQMKLKYLENNSSFIDMLSALKFTGEKIVEIEQLYAEAVALETICQDNLLAQERKIKELIKQKEQEEKFKQEEALKEIQKAKEEARESELRLKEINKLKKLMEEESKQSEKENDHFMKFRYYLPNSEFGKNGIGCLVKVLPEFMGSKSDIIVDLLDPLTIPCDFDGSDEIVSNIIRIGSAHSANDNLKFDQAFSIILPHNMIRTPGRETKIFKYLLEELRWISVDTLDVTMEDTDKCGARFVEAIFDELPLTLTVVSVPRIEELQYGKRGCNWTATVDSRVNIMIPPGSVKINLSMKITTIAFDSSLSQDVKAKSKGTNADNIYAFTHLLKIESQNRNLLKPFIISLPLPQKQLTESKSGGMSMAVFGSNTESRPKANFGSQGQEEKIYLLSMDSNRKWVENSELNFELDEKKDTIKYDIDKLSDMAFMGVRARPEASTEQIGKGVEIILNHFKLRQIKIIVANHVEDNNLITFIPCLSSKIDKSLRSLKEEGFDDKDIQISSEIEINEREILCLRFRGNIKVKGEAESYVRKLMYCSQLKNKMEIRLEVVDKYGQRAKTKYEGFLSITTSKWTKKPQPRIEGQARKGPRVMIDIEEIVPLYEALLVIPKNQLYTHQFVNREFHFVSQDCVTEDFLRQLSGKIRKDWKLLAQALDLSPNRIEEISAIIPDDKHNSKKSYKVLKLWVMHLPVARDKEKILNKALHSINRPDLVKEVQL